MKSRSSLFICLSLAFLLSAAFTTAARAEGEPEILSVTPGKIYRGGMITITGKNLIKEGAGTVVTIDGVKAQYVERVSEEEIKVRIDKVPKSRVKKRAGEYKRSITVMVDKQKSNQYSFTQLTWEAVLQPHVVFVLILYLAVVGGIVLGADASAFRSKTGQLSLSKIQMGLWTFFFGLTYVVLAAIRKEFLDITDGMFWLMGISSATAVGAKAIVLKNKINPDAPFPSMLLMDYDSNAATFKITDPSLKKLKSEKVPKNVLDKLKGLKSKTEEYIGEEKFIKILLTKITEDEFNEYKKSLLVHNVCKPGYRLSLHRCQIALWTLIVLAIYLINYFGTMRLPVIPDKLLVLMGVSGGTYLGFNYPKPKEENGSKP
jgi:hypothetical protein